FTFQIGMARSLPASASSVVRRRTIEVKKGTRVGAPGSRSPWRSSSRRDVAARAADSVLLTPALDGVGHAAQSVELVRALLDNLIPPVRDGLVPKAHQPAVDGTGDLGERGDASQQPDDERRQDRYAEE